MPLNGDEPWLDASFSNSSRAASAVLRRGERGFRVAPGVVGTHAAGALDVIARVRVGRIVRSTLRFGGRGTPHLLACGIIDVGDGRLQLVIDADPAHGLGRLLDRLGNYYPDRLPGIACASLASSWRMRPTAMMCA
jgi:hypothetical protein